MTISYGQLELPLQGCNGHCGPASCFRPTTASRLVQSWRRTAAQHDAAVGRVHDLVDQAALGRLATGQVGLLVAPLALGPSAAPEAPVQDLHRAR